MADVHLARILGPEGFERLCVVKRLLPHLKARADYVRMFLDEARIAAALTHPNIISVFDMGQADGGYFMAMEFLHGCDLGQLIRRVSRGQGRLTEEQALTVALGACAGLDYAHEKSGADGQPLGIVHRDVSPNNIFLTFGGHVKIVDFGIADATIRATDTQSGVIKGKLGYMAPEQIAGAKLDRRADVFALCVVLWELLAGKRLYPSGASFEALRTALERDAPDLADAGVEVSQELQAIVTRGLARHRDQRYLSARDLHDALEGYAREQGMTCTPASLTRLMDEYFQDRIDVRQIAAAPGEATAVVPSAVEALPEEDVSLGSVFTSTALAAPRTNADTDGASRSRIRRLGWIVGLGVSLAAAAGGAWWLATHSPSSQGATTADDPPPKPASAPTPAERSEDVRATEASALEKPVPEASGVKTAPTKTRPESPRRPRRSRAQRSRSGAKAAAPTWDPDGPFPP
jgi:serine/threonine-protein kinase